MTTILQTPDGYVRWHSEGFIEYDFPEKGSNGAIEALVAELLKYRNPEPGDLEQQAAAWVAVYRALVDAGMQRYWHKMPVNGRDSACDYVRHLDKAITSLIGEKADLASENAKLRDELAVFLEGCVLDASVESEAERGWLELDEDVITEADRLVELGLYERHPDGTGRRQFYRKKTT